MENLKATDIMTKNVLTVTEDTSVKEVAKMFAENRIGGAPVVQGKIVVGMITEDDLIMQDVKVHFPTYIHFLDSFIYLGSLKRFEQELRKAVGARAKDVMSKEVVSVNENDSVEDIATLMVDKRINRLPVLRKGELVGIITKGDIVRAISRT